MTTSDVVDTHVPYRLTRLGEIMTATPGDAFEVGGVLNPGSGRSPDGRLWLLPRLVAGGNVSRIGLAEVLLDAGVPVGVRREGIVLAPDAGWEHSHDHGGVEDPRVTWMPTLGLHVMSYVAFGPLGPRSALAVSADLASWRRLGPIHFGFQADLDTDLNLFPNKDVVFFPGEVPDESGRACFAILHRPMWDLGMVLGGEDVFVPTGVADPRPGIWISYVPVEEVAADLGALTRVRSHRLVALPRYGFESVKIGAGPPPVRVEEGWLLIHHGVSGTLAPGWAPQTDVIYSAGAMLLSADDPGTVLARTSGPLLAPTAAEELSGAVPNVVFPSAIEEIDGRRYIFYGMADTSIGVARLDRLESP